MRAIGRAVRISVGIALLAGIALPTFAQRDYAYALVQGRLHDASRPRPVAGATVRLTGADQVLEATSDQRGVFVFEKVPLASYEMQIIAVDGTPLQAMRDTRPGESLGIRLKPRSAGVEPILVDATPDGVAFAVPQRSTNWRKLWIEIGVFVGVAGALSL